MRRNTFWFSTRVWSMRGELSFFKFVICQVSCRFRVWDMRGEMSFLSLGYERRVIGFWILRYERRVVVRWVWNIPCKLWVFKFEVCQKSCRSSSLRNVSWLNFVANFVPTIAVNWLFDNKQWNNIVINTTGVTYEAGPAYPTRALGFTHSFSCVRV